MESWWQLGEWSGHRGESLAVYQLTCPFCMESGNFETAFHAEKKKPNSDKKLNFDTLKCVSCSGYVMVLWSATEHGFGYGVHDYRVLPFPLKLDRHPDHWPATVGRFWLQAKRSLVGENWDAAIQMARSALQAALRDQGASGSNLKNDIDQLAGDGVLPPIMKEWSTEVRQLGNRSAHPDQKENPPTGQDARELVRFLDFFLECTYSLPHAIGEYRKRLSQDAEPQQS